MLPAIAWPQAGRRALPTIILLFALVALHVQVLGDLGISAKEAWASGLVAGLACDLMAATFPSLLTALTQSVFGRDSRVVWAVAAIAVWLATLANAAYMRFFHMALDWWIVRLHWHDMSDVSDSATELSVTRLGVASAVLLVAAIVARVRSGQAHARGRRQAATRTLALAALVVLLWEAPAAVSINDGSPLVKDHIIRYWLMQNFRPGLYQGVGAAWAAHLEVDKQPADERAPSRYLVGYRDYHDDALLTAASLARLESFGPLRDEPEYPLVRTLAPDAERTRAARRELGLPETGALRVVIAFVESFRSFEFDEPTIGPLIFPRLNAVLARYGRRYRQAYTSAHNAGSTARGDFSTLCSMLPNMTGPAEYLAFTTLRVQCVQELFREAGYHTVYSNAHRATFHQTRLFESLHGTLDFYDRPYYEAQGVTPFAGIWGLPDGPYLRESAKLIDHLGADGRPVFFTVSTLTTHPAYSVIAEGPVPAALMQAAEDSPEYQGFLSRFRYADGALADFIEHLFVGPDAERTLVVMLGDHGVGVRPYLPMTRLQQDELDYRIMLALLTKGMPNPGVRDTLAHQVDVAPTVAAVAGLSGKVAWVGRNLLDGEGSPWLYASGNGDLRFRTPSRRCARDAGGAVACVATVGVDPQHEAAPKVASVNAAEVRLFEGVSRSTFLSIAGNRLLPPP